MMTRKPNVQRSFRQDVGTIGIAATAAICAGLLINQFRDSPLPLVYQTKEERVSKAVEKIGNPILKAGTPAVATIREVGLSEFAEVSKAADALILDARPEIFHRLGHIPKAIALPRDEFESYYEKERALLEANKLKPILVYCSGAACKDSHMVAHALQKLGFSNILIFKGGWAEWQKSNLPEEAS